MKRFLVSSVLLACLVVPTQARAQKAALIVNGAAAPNATDQSVIDRLEEEFDLQTVLIDHSEGGARKNEILDDEEPDIIVILESTNSGNVTNQLNDREEPILVGEAFVYDDMGFVQGTSGCTDCWGDQGNDFGNQSNETDLEIVNDDHPIIKAAGLDGGGLVSVYETPGRIQWGRNLIEDMEILAVAANGFDEDGDGTSDDAAVFVAEPGAELVDGSQLAGLRIAFWMHTEGGDVLNLTPQGLDLFDAMVGYALDWTVPGQCGEAPASATRDIQTSLDPAQAHCGGDFKEGDLIAVEIEVTDLRQAAGDCAVPAGIRIAEEPPAGWTVSEISDGGTLSEGVITWDLAAGDIGASRKVGYKVTATVPAIQSRFRFDGDLVEIDAGGDPTGGRPRNIEGENSILSDPEECPGKAVLILANAANPGAGDQAVVDRLQQEFGMETVLIDHAVDGFTKNEIIDNEEPEVIIILESTSSGNVTNQLNDRTEPIITHESFLYDDMGFVLGTSGCDLCWGDLGNDFGNQSGETDLTVVAQDHPIIKAAGLDGTDVFETYDQPGRIVWGSNLIEDAEILTVATRGFDADGDGISDDVTTFVVEKGAELVDGTEAAGLRIGGWIQNENEGFTRLTQEGLALWDACLLYALDKLDTGPIEPRMVRGDADSDGSVTLTDGIVILDWLFQGGEEPRCVDAADTDDDGGVILTDAVIIFGWLFASGPPPAPPSPTVGSYPPGDCGVDAGEDQLGCANPSLKCSP